MESSEKDAYLLHSPASWTAAATWTVAGGSLADSVTLESSLSQIDDPSGSDRDQSSPTDSESKLPLILCPPSPQPAPCEITITFQQKQEVRQVYVRSTARVFEIYYATEPNGESEYLCTVRCGLAMRDEGVLRISDVEEALLPDSTGTVKESAEQKVGKGSEPITNEDDWVEVKAPNRSRSASNPQKNSQDLFEATAEITDPNPCMILTLRLLSLQNKGWVCVDEVYVFADPVDAASLDNQVAPVENSAGSSLMAMLVPAFYQLSKTNAICGAQDKCSSDVAQRKKSEETGTEATEPITIRNEKQQQMKFQQAGEPAAEPVVRELKFQEVVEPMARQVQLQDSVKVSAEESRCHAPGLHIEGVLDQLVTRVSRIEDLFLRFEESMLKPIRSIDERLQQVEQQLEVLTKKNEKSGFTYCTRISAPEFSYSESETNSFYNSECRDVNSLACETNKKVSPSELMSVPLDGPLDSATTTAFHPSLVVTAPEFNYDEEENLSTEPVKEKGIEKRAVSIDAALGNYLAQFLPSTSVQLQKHSQTLAIKAPEFPLEENADETTASPKKISERTTNLSTSANEADGPEPMKSSLTLSHISDVENAMGSTKEINFGKIDEGVDGLWKHKEAVEGDVQGTSIHHNSTLITNFKAGIDSFQRTDGALVEEVSNGISNISSVEETDSPKQFSGNEIDNVSVPGGVLNELGTSTEVIEADPKEDILHNVVELPTTSHVDYGTPILDVQFGFQENSGAKSPLEALLAGTPVSNVEATLVEEGGDEGFDLFDMESVLDTVNDWGAIDSATGAHLSVDVDYYSIGHVPLDISCSNQEVSPASLI
ncbi:hypothetical protein Tsubulata_000574 [Turnera subulata]|uniref:Uncharacterized protein n=1 Tax=Turnera subulata TaxID=218843 RepID=A0A9Q0FN30_9ROSI|nr:hypothetical protein Tsubulata_000574 [Turnera subulata]